MKRVKGKSASGRWRRITEEIRDSNPIDEVLEERDIDLRQTGTGWSCLCPLPGHDDTKPSFSVSEDARFFFCFGCGHKGDVFTLVQQLDGIDFMTARAKLAKRAGINLSTKRKG